MNEHAKKWVEYLRSGIYKQTTGKLRGAKGFCCLGVACDLYAKENDVEWDGQEFMGSFDALPEAVRKWLGLSTPLGEYEASALSEENDKRKPFSRIADIIESEPEGLFKPEAK